MSGQKPARREGPPRLGLGVRVENGYRGIHRIWSRPWFEEAAPSE